MTSVFDKIQGLQSRYSLKNAVTLSDVLNSSPPLKDDLKPLDYDFEQRDTSNRLFSNPNQLTNIMDVLQLHLYWMEFCGEGDRARKDSKFLVKGWRLT